MAKKSAPPTTPPPISPKLGKPGKPEKAKRPGKAAAAPEPEHKAKGPEPKRALGPLASATLAWRPAVHSVLIDPRGPSSASRPSEPGKASKPSEASEPPRAPKVHKASALLPEEPEVDSEAARDRRRPGRARRASSIPLAAQGHKAGPAPGPGAAPVQAAVWDALRGLRLELDALIELCNEPAPQLEASREPS